jgi:glucoamylase
MAYLSGLSGDTALWTDHIKPAADFLVSHGPSYGVERWEEQSGYSPSTIAAEIAGLTAASAIADEHGDRADARLYQATADDYQRNTKNWTVTSTGPDSSSPYFIRLSKTGDPNAATSYNLGNGAPTLDQRSVIDGGFQELVRLGELAPTDPTFANSLAVLDKQISVSTPSGTGYYRYGDSAASGSADGYGDCSTTDSQTSCGTSGQPWPTTDVGTGHLWPVLSGERAESAIATGDTSTASSLLSFMIKSASGVGLVPEQVWEDPDLAASPFGSDPTSASIGFTDGQAAGSASPLTWAQAQELRLIVDLGDGHAVDRPAITTARYVTHGAPGAAWVT